MIKPKFWDDTKIAKLKRDARLLYIGMWNFSDDSGVLIADPIWIKSKVFPYDKDLQLSQFENWLTDLERLGFICRLRYRGEGFIYLPNFSRHQTINRPNVDDLNIPEADLESFLNNSVNNHGTISDESPPKLSKEEDKKREDKAHAPPLVEIFFPFDEDFKNHWYQWKDFKKIEFKFHYKSPQSEQSSVNELVKLAGGIKETAIAIINQSMANGWKGFFELKNVKNGSGNPANGAKNKSVTGSSLNEAHAKYFGQ